MLTRIKTEFPELYTKRGTIKKQAPKKYKCECGHEFNKTKSVRVGGIGFAIPICEKCHLKGKVSVAFKIWNRMITNQIEHEDYILELVQSRNTILKEELKDILTKQFKDYDGKALSHLVYYGYLTVDKRKRDEQGIVEYSIATKPSTDRYELI